MLQSITPPFHHTNDLPTAQIQNTYRHDSLPPSCHRTHSNAASESPHQRSRWEYIIWSEKQLVLTISAACAGAEVISPSSRTSAGLQIQSGRWALHNRASDPTQATWKGRLIGREEPTIAATNHPSQADDGTVPSAEDQNHHSLHKLYNSWFVDGGMSDVTPLETQPEPGQALRMFSGS